MPAAQTDPVPVVVLFGATALGKTEIAVEIAELLGAEIVTAEMAIFEWLGTAEHPRFREAAALVK